MRRPARAFKGSRIPAFSVAVLVGLAVLASLPAQLAPHDPNKQVLLERFTPPAWQSGSRPGHLLGTDHLGRDILSRIIHGSRVSLAAAVLSLLLGGVVGTVIGLVGGYFGGTLDAVLMRFADSTLAFPWILFAFLLAVTLGPSMRNVVIAIAIVVWAHYARVVRGEVLSLRERDFVRLARVAGCSSWRVILVHICPNVVNTLVVLVTLQLGWVIIMEASLSFLGAGIPLPTPAWGSMIAEGRQYIARAWWVVSIPGVVLMLTVLAFNRLGDWLRDVLDPKLRNVGL